MSLSASQSRTQQESTDSRIAAAEHAVAGRADNGATLIQVGSGSDVVSLQALKSIENVVMGTGETALANREIDAELLNNAFAQQSSLVNAVNDRFASIAETKLTGGQSDTNKLFLYLGGGVVAVLGLALLRRK